MDSLPLISEHYGIHQPGPWRRIVVEHMLSIGGQRMLVDRITRMEPMCGTDFELLYALRDEPAAIDHVIRCFEAAVPVPSVLGRHGDRHSGPLGREVPAVVPPPQRRDGARLHPPRRRLVVGVALTLERSRPPPTSPTAPM